MNETKLEKLLHMYCMNDGAGLMTDAGEKQQEELKADLEKAIKFHDDCDSSLNSTLGVIKESQKENKRLNDKFQLLLKYTGRDVVSCIKHINELEDYKMAAEAEAQLADNLQKENRKLKIRIEADESIYQVQKKLLSNTRRSFYKLEEFYAHQVSMKEWIAELLAKYILDNQKHMDKINTNTEQLNNRIEGLKELVDVHIGEKRDLSKMLDNLRELIRYKEGWVRVNSYRISEHQKAIVIGEIKELKTIIGAEYLHE